MSNDYLVGEVARIDLDVTTPDGEAVDPGGLTLKLKPPQAAVVTHTYGAGTDIVRDALGKFHADIQLTAAGIWAWRWDLAAPNAGAIEGTLIVQPSRFPS